MLFNSLLRVKCIAVPEPRAWEYNGRSGVAYKVHLSDGVDVLQFPVSDIDVYQKFMPFHDYEVTLEVSQVAQDSRIFTKSRVVAASEID